MPERFTETLRAASEASWSHAVQHRFVNELFAGAVPDAVMARYLIQDHRFLDSFLVLLGAALASADTFAARLRFGRFARAPTKKGSPHALSSINFRRCALACSLQLPASSHGGPSFVSRSYRCGRGQGSLSCMCCPS